MSENKPIFDILNINLPSISGECNIFFPCRREPAAVLPGVVGLEAASVLPAGGRKCSVPMILPVVDTMFPLFPAPRQGEWLGSCRSLTRRRLPRYFPSSAPG